MNELGPTEILRRSDGSIDIDFYAAKAARERCYAMNGGVRTGTLLLLSHVRIIAIRLGRLIRPSVAFPGIRR